MADLIEYFGGIEIPSETDFSRIAEGASHSASDLGGHANSDSFILIGSFSHKIHCFDIFPVMSLKQKLDCTV